MPPAAEPSRGARAPTCAIGPPSCSLPPTACKASLTHAPSPAACLPPCRTCSAGRPQSPWPSQCLQGRWACCPTWQRRQRWAPRQAGSRRQLPALARVSERWQHGACTGLAGGSSSGSRCLPLSCAARPIVVFCTVVCRMLGTSAPTVADKQRRSGVPAQALSARSGCSPRSRRARGRPACPPCGTGWPTHPAGS